MVSDLDLGKGMGYIDDVSEICNSDLLKKKQNHLQEENKQDGEEVVNQDIVGIYTLLKEEGRR